MPLWMCSVADCPRPAVRNLGDCVICGQHLCLLHVQKPVHHCPVWNDGDVYDDAAVRAEKQELQSLLSRIDTDALAARASDLRGGIPCTIPTPVYSSQNRAAVMGGMNYHVKVPFHDGAVWLARIRRNNITSPPQAAGNYIVKSEVATLRFLADIVPLARTPRIYDYSLSGSESPVGVSYMLMEMLPGQSLQWPDNVPQRKSVMNCLANVFIELSKHPLPLMGSLSIATGGGNVGPVARESFMDVHDGHLSHSGPFATAVEYYRKDISLVLGRILDGELYTTRRIDAYLLHLFLHDLAPHILPSDNVFYVKHADDKGDHLLVDDNYNLTGVIDWEWAYTAPAAIAFNSPIMLFNVGDFYNGVTHISNDEAVFAQLLQDKGRDDLAQHVRNGRALHFFAFCCGNDIENDWDGFVGLFRGLRDTANVDAGLDWDSWKAKALKTYADDDGLKQLSRSSQ